MVGARGISDWLRMTRPEGRVCWEMTVMRWSSLAFFSGTGEAGSLIMGGVILGFGGVCYQPEWIRSSSRCKD